MTKDEILNNAIGDIIEYPDYELNTFQRLSCISAMDEWAKQEAIAFARFVDLNGYTEVSLNKWKSLSDEIGKTGSQLYELYQQSKTQ